MNAPYPPSILPRHRNQSGSSSESIARTAHLTARSLPGKKLALAPQPHTPKGLPMYRRLLAVALAIASLVALAANAPAPVKGPKPIRIAMGKEVAIADYAVPGKTTVFDFTSEFCPPCRAIAPRLDELHARRADVAVVKVDINRPDVKGIDWKSPVAQQYKMRSIPHFKVFGPDGKLIAEGDKAREMVTAWFEK